MSRYAVTPVMSGVSTSAIAESSQKPAMLQLRSLAIAENPCSLYVLILHKIPEDADLHHSDPHPFFATLTAYTAGFIEAQ
jgi:hypothetical protein